MCKADLAPHPFGSLITAEGLQQRFSAFQRWEDRYRQLILLGRELPALNEALKQPEIELRTAKIGYGWVHQRHADGRLHFYGDSEGRIVRGLLAVLASLRLKDRQRTPSHQRSAGAVCAAGPASANQYLAQRRTGSPGRCGKKSGGVNNFMAGRGLNAPATFQSMAHRNKPNSRRHHSCAAKT